MEEGPLQTLKQGWHPLPPSNGTLPHRSGHNSWAFNDALYVTHGFNSSNGVFRCFNDMHRLDLKTRRWEAIHAAGDVPSPRTSASIAVSHATKEVFFFGGSGKVFGHSNHGGAYVLDLPTLTYKEIVLSGDVPCARYGSSMSYYNGSLYLLGGTTGFVFFHDFHVIDTATGACRRLSPGGTPPPAFYRQESVVVGDRMLVFGAQPREDGTLPMDVYEYTFVDNTWRQVSTKGDAPVGRFGHSATVLRIHGAQHVALFGGIPVGGEASTTPEADSVVFLLDLATLTWTQFASDASPEAYKFHAAAAFPLGSNGSLFNGGFWQDDEAADVDTDALVVVGGTGVAERRSDAVYTFRPVSAVPKLFDLAVAAVVNRAVCLNNLPNHLVEVIHSVQETKEVVKGVIAMNEELRHSPKGLA